MADSVMHIRGGTKRRGLLLNDLRQLGQRVWRQSMRLEHFEDHGAHHARRAAARASRTAERGQLSRGQTPLTLGIHSHPEPPHANLVLCLTQDYSPTSPGRAANTAAIAAALASVS